MTCARVRCKRRVDSVAASPREYLVKRAAKNVISPPQPPPKTPQNPPQETTMQTSKVACKLQEEVDDVCQGTVQEKSRERSSKSKRISCKAGSQERYQPPPNTPPKPPKPPPKKQQCKHQKWLANYKKKLMTCARVRCKRRVDSVAASPREYLVKRAAKNVISPPQNPQKPPPRACEVLEGKFTT